MKPPAPPLSIVASAAAPGRRFWVWAAGVSLAATLGVFIATGQVRGPRLSLLAAEPPQVVIHLTAALLALAIGLVLMAGVKGSRMHRLLGWSWVAAMGTTAVSSIFIRQINVGDFSWIHLFTGWTIVGLPAALWAVRRRRIALHARAMTGMFVGGLLIAGAFTFVPGRLMWRLFF